MKRKGERDIKMGSGEREEYKVKWFDKNADPP